MVGKVVEARREAYVSLGIEQAGEIEKVLGRVHPRVPARIPVRIERLTSGPLDVFTEDLSLGGVRVLSPIAIRANRAVRVLMDMGVSLGTVYSLAKAVRCEQAGAGGYTIGFSFIDPQESDCQRIEALMERLAEGRPFQPSPGFPQSVSNVGRAFDADHVFRARMVQVLKSPDYDGVFSLRAVSAEKSSLKLAAPMVAVGDMNPRIGDDVWVRCLAEDGLFEAPGQIASQACGSYLVIGVRLLDKAMRIQRRQYPRVDTSLSTDLGETGQATEKTRTKNLSGGGAMALCSQPMPAGQMLNARIDLPDGGEPIMARPRVVWCRPAPEGGFHIGMHFVDMAPEARQRIVTYCADEERRQATSYRQDAQQGS